MVALLFIKILCTESAMSPERKRKENEGVIWLLWHSFQTDQKMTNESFCKEEPSREKLEPFTAGVARWSVSGLRRLPAPPPRIMENTVLGFANFFTFCSLGATCLFKKITASSQTTGSCNCSLWPITSANLELNGKNRHQGRCTNNLFWGQFHVISP